MPPILIVFATLKDINKAIGVSSYQFVESIPEPLKELELGLGNIDVEDAQSSD